MTAPAVVIRLELERRPRVSIDALNDGEEARLADWLETKAEYAELVERALELAREAKAA